MLEQLRTFWDIALWRRDPGQLPCSWALVAATAAAYLLVSWAQAWQLYGEDRALLRAAADLALTLLVFRAVLALAGRPARFQQAIAAVLGVSALLSLPMMVVAGLREPAAEHYPVALLAWVASLALIVWYLFALGHVIRSALETGLFTAMVISVTFAFGSSAVLTRLIPTGP